MSRGNLASGTSRPRPLGRVAHSSHVGRADAHFVLLLIVGEEKGGDENKVSRGPAPGGRHHASITTRPEGSSATVLPLEQSVSVSLEFGFHSPAAPSRRRWFPHHDPFVDSGPVCKPRESKLSML